ncbi:daunorubicin/doxorubicin resistance ABC transporter ATP-binding protein DrrA, partial [Candidatus Woesearchaeota archaeon]
MEEVFVWVVETRGLVKFFGDIVALDGLDLRIPKGVS